MASFRFYLLNAKDKNGKLKKQELSIYLFVNHKGNRWFFKTEQRIEPKHWNFGAGEVKGSYKRGCIEINDKLDAIKKQAQAAYTEWEGKVAAALLREKIALSLEGNQDTDSLVLPVVEAFILSQQGIRKENTIKKYEGLKAAIEKNWPGLSFEGVNMNFYDAFRGEMLSRGLLNDSIAKNISTLKTFMDWALSRGLHQNLTYKQFEAKRTVKVDIITNTEEELKKLGEVEGLNKRQERVRDLYLFQVYTGQRFSDVQAFRKEDLRGSMWVFEQVKTGQLVSVPLIGWAAPALSILDKYNFDLPQISNQRFNDYIKEVGELAEINEPIEIKRKSGSKLVIMKKPKWQFMSSHTARRTAVTLLLEKGVPATTVMKMTGHTNLRTMQKYENTSVEALAKALEGLG
jgi:integrase